MPPDLKPGKNTIKDLIIRTLPPAPEGFWSTPGGKAGLQGMVTGVNKTIDAMKIDEHWKDAMKSGIAAEIARTGGNFVEIHAHAQRGDDDLNVTIHIKTSKKSI